MIKSSVTAIVKFSQLLLCFGWRISKRIMKTCMYMIGTFFAMIFSGRYVQDSITMETHLVVEKIHLPPYLISILRRVCSLCRLVLSFAS